MKNQQIAIGIDIGGTNTKIGALYPNGDVLEYKTYPTNGAEIPEEFIEHIAQDFSLALKNKINISLGNPQIIGVGAGAPMANFLTGKVNYAPNLGWKNVALKEIIENIFQCPSIIDNDANLAAIGEKKWGAGKDFSDFVLITLGTGVGTGLILSNKVYRGYQGLGGEGGHIIIPHNKQRLCSCGGVNHLESYLSAKGIKQTIHEIIEENWTIEKLGQSFIDNDPKAFSVMNQISLELAMGLASMGVILGPQAFIIGGGISKLGNSLTQLVKLKLDEILHFSLKGKINIFTSTLSGDKGAISGGAAAVFDKEKV